MFSLIRRFWKESGRASTLQSFLYEYKKMQDNKIGCLYMTKESAIVGIAVYMGFCILVGFLYFLSFINVNDTIGKKIIHTIVYMPFLLIVVYNVWQDIRQYRFLIKKKNPYIKLDRTGMAVYNWHCQGYTFITWEEFDKLQIGTWENDAFFVVVKDKRTFSLRQPKLISRLCMYLYGINAKGSVCRIPFRNLRIRRTVFVSIVNSWARNA